MKISHGSQFEEVSEYNGYGYATANMIASLERLGHEVTLNDPSADVEIWFDQPEHWKFSKGPYRIGYHPWESTQLLKSRKPDWYEQMNQCDEIWTPSPLIAQWYKDYMNIKPPVYVYEHGVDPVWKPKKRAVDGTFKFLHCGGEAQRKGSKETMQCFRLAFDKNDDVHMTMKLLSPGWNIGWLNRVEFLNKMMSLEELIQLYHDHHVYVYPSWGEGFGLTPLQAMATGMPTITVPGWAPYADFLDPSLSLSSKLVRSPWPILHPGMMLEPNTDELIENLRYSRNNYEELQSRAHERIQPILDHYNWDRLTAEAFDALEVRLKK